MTPTENNSSARVTSRDGTEIAYYSSGEGPPLLLVHGILSDHNRWAPLLPYLEPQRTVHTMDRRGRGASGDHSEYDVTREFEDIAALVDAIAEQSGSPIDLHGHSSGGAYLIPAATLTSNMGLAGPQLNVIPFGCRSRPRGGPEALATLAMSRSGSHPGRGPAREICERWS